MSEEKSADTPKRSFVDPAEEKKNVRITRPPQGETIFPKMDKMIEEMKKANQSRAVIAYQLTRIADKLTGQKTKYDKDGGMVFDDDSVFVDTKPPIPPSDGTSKPVAPPVAPTPAPISATQKVKENFPQELQDLLHFNETAEHVIIKPRQYLGSENFAKIASVVREIGGEYISAGKESHFRVGK